MDADTPSEVGLPRDELAGQTAFCDIEDNVWREWLLHRLAQGDVVVVERSGDLLIFSP